MTTNTLTHSPATLDYRKDEHSLHPYVWIVLICAAIGAISSALHSAIPMLQQIASGGWPLRYEKFWLAHELSQIVIGLSCATTVIALLAGWMSRKQARVVLASVLLALLVMHVIYDANKVTQRHSLGLLSSSA